MSQTLTLSVPAFAFAPAAAARPARFALVRKIWLDCVAVAREVSSYGVIEGAVTIGTLGFATVVIAQFW